MRVPGGGWKRDEPHQLFERQAVAKPACLTSYTSAYRQSSACSCASITPATVYTTRTVTPTTTLVSTVRTTSTSWITATRTNTILQTRITGTVTNTIVSTTTQSFTSTIVRNALVSTTVVRGYISTTTRSATETAFALAAAPTFYIQNDQTNYAYLSPPSSDSKKSKRDISGTIAFDSIQQSAAQLFTLPGLTGGLLSNTGLLAAESVQGPDDFDDIDVQLVDATDIATGAFAPVSCTFLGQQTDGTCPLQCQFGASSDVTQGDPFGNWMVGQPGAASSETFGVFAVGSWGAGAPVSQVKKTGRRV
ncbi:hypothetical protein Slin15195_G042710 [Septoria linicola]|uniref:Uncharacterized protein n=1 Tax=Septoria linicola TaxID=215465 RepID=A0A9Q9ARY4_9PEZI|nr:hypothetical protein Slin14017_G046230 [Septoria linicola]USW50952.1 hypothetical protein Slin15195_G042710 [Septoria linicola]